ncbi:MAG: 6,7-dimethyl-8-ribityllumazine synthase [Kiritimatiellae bacterium]|nr:6,7-dimethyl-8-ribityllumazine synthase [Kiritimatiellia bacterium]
MKEVNGALDARGMKTALVVSRFNSFLTEQLVKGAIDAFVRLGGSEKDMVVVRVPGAYEIPVVAKRLASGGSVDAVVALGAVVQGATAHAALINETTARAFSEISLETGVPVVDGVVSAESLEQAVERCGTKQGNKGFSAMQAAIETVNVLKGLKK